MFKKEIKLKLQFLHRTSHIASAQEPQVASGSCDGHCGSRRFPPSQEGQSDGTALSPLSLLLYDSYLERLEAAAP